MERPEPGLYFVASSGNRGAVRFAPSPNGIAFSIHWEQEPERVEVEEFAAIAGNLVSVVANHTANKLEAEAPEVYFKEGGNLGRPKPKGEC